MWQILLAVAIGMGLFVLVLYGVNALFEALDGHVEDRNE